MKRAHQFLATAAFLFAATAMAQPIWIFDLATASTDDGNLLRVLGSTGTGTFGVPVAGGVDVDGDGHADAAVAFFLASPSGRTQAGEVDLVFGDGTVRATLDTAFDQRRVLRIFGVQTAETAGSEIWMDDVTGDGLADLLVCRQGYSPPGRSGAGALSIVAGGAALRALAASLTPLDLGAPPAGVTVTDLWGATVGSRLCIWARTGDVDGDGIADVVVGADQESTGVTTHHGGVYVLAGGAHLASGTAYDLASPVASGLAGRLAHVTPAPGSTEYHLGATCQIADLDGNGRGEVLAAATLNRAGASLAGHGAGGAPRGRLFIFWDDNFTPPWPDVLEFSWSSRPGAGTEIAGGQDNVNFGEEILGGEDFDGEGNADLFVGDLTGDATGSRFRSGIGYVFYQAAGLKGLSFAVDSAPPGVGSSTIWGPIANAIGGDTAAQGDFDGDGLADLAFCSPHASPEGRLEAGVAHLFLGRAGGWPATIDTAALPSPEALRTIEIRGGHGRVGGDRGDTLCYSAAAGDFDGDGGSEIVVNEMTGNGSSAVDVGNLIVVSATAIFSDGFESGDTSAWSAQVN